MLGTREDRKDCPRVLGKLNNMKKEGGYHPAQQPDGEQMTLVIPNTPRKGRGGGEEEK